MLGNGGVGKSAVVVRFVSGTFVEKYDPTIEDFYRKEIAVFDSSTVLEILDTAGREQFASMRDLYIKNGQGFIVMFSVINGATLEDINDMMGQICRVKGQSPAELPIILVGNKMDLEYERIVSKAEGETLAQTWKCLYLETSAKTGHNVEFLFSEMVRILPEKLTKRRSSRCCVLL